MLYTFFDYSFRAYRTKSFTKKNIYDLMQISESRVKRGPHSCLKRHSWIFKKDNYMKIGTIHIMGSNSGDPELLTLQSKKWLESADLIFYEPSIHSNLFSFSKKEARWISLAQAKKKRIEALLQKEEELNHTVVFILSKSPEKALVNTFFDTSTFTYELLPSVKPMQDSNEKKKRARVIVLRGADQAQGIVEDLLAQGLDVIPCPMIEVHANPQALNLVSVAFIAKFTSLIFTSANGVSIFLNHMREKGIDFRTLAGKKVFTVGPKTANTLKSFGIFPDGIPEKFVAEHILDLFGDDLRKEKILIPSAAGARPILSQELKAKGAKVSVLKVYRTHVPKLKPISILSGDLVIFTSSSTADHFFNSKLFKNQEIISFCIGEITQKSVSKYVAKDIYISKEATSESLVQCICEFLEKNRM